MYSPEIWWFAKKVVSLGCKNKKTTTAVARLTEDKSTACFVRTHDFWKVFNRRYE